MAGAGPGRAPRPPAACPGAVPRPRRHYRVEVEHGAHQDQQEGDGEDGEVQHGRAGAGEKPGPHPPPRGRKGRAGPGRAEAGRGMGCPRRLLLVSNSTLHGGGYLGHCQQHIQSFLGG